jgi:hypothetical protein
MTLFPTRLDINLRWGSRRHAGTWPLLRLEMRVGPGSALRLRGASVRDDQAGGFQDGGGRALPGLSPTNAKYHRHPSEGWGPDSRAVICLIKLRFPTRPALRVRVPACAGMTIYGSTYPRPLQPRVCFSCSGRTGGVSSVICGDRERGAHTHKGLTTCVLVRPPGRKSGTRA